MDNSNNDKNVIIENKYKVTKDMYKKWAMENKKVIYFRIFWAIILIILLILIGLFVLNDGSIPIILGILVVYALFFPLLVRRLKIGAVYNKLSKFYKQNDWERVIRFYDDYIECVDAGTNTIKVKYEDITDIEQKNDCLKIKMNGGYLRVYNESYTKSNTEECEKFIRAKTAELQNK